jgi:hypothetical protein
MTNGKTILLSGLLLASLLPVQLCAAHPLLQPPAAASVALPVTPAGVKAAMFLEAINSGDAEKLAAITKQHYPGQVDNPQGRMIQERTKGLDVTAVDQSAEHELVLSLKSRASGNAVKMRVVVEPGPPHTVRSIGLQF